MRRQVFILKMCVTTQKRVRTTALHYNSIFEIILYYFNCVFTILCLTFAVVDNDLAQVLRMAAGLILVK